MATLKGFSTQKFNARRPFELYSSGCVPFVPTPKQKQGLTLVNNPYVHRLLFDGGSRSGKTLSLIRYCFNVCLQVPGIKILIARKTRRAVKASVWQDFKSYRAKYVPNSGNMCKFRESDLEIWFRDGSRVYFDGLDNNERIEKIRGREYCVIWINEATDITYLMLSVLEDRLAQVVPVRLPAGNPGPRYKQMLMMDCNPKHPRHWLHLLGIQNLNPENGDPLPLDTVTGGEYINLRYHRLNWSAFDNTDNLSAAYIATLKAMPKVRRMRMLDGIWCSQEGLVYDEFREDVHTIDPFPIPNDWRRFRGIDFGYTNPFACCWFALDHDDTLYITDTHMREKMLVEEHAQIIEERSENNHYDALVADWEAEQRANLEKKLHVDVTPAPFCKSIRLGIDMVKSRLKVRGNGKPRLLVFRTEENQALINEFFAYKEPEENEDKNNDENPIDANNHALSAVRYVVMHIDEGKIGDVTGIFSEKEQENGLGEYF